MVIPIEKDLCFLLQKMSRRLSRRINLALKELGLTGEQVVMLEAIEALDCPRYNALHVELGLDHSTVSANIRRLLQRSLIVSFEDPTDRRAKRLKLTTEGERRLAAGRLILTEFDLALQTKLEASGGLARVTWALNILASGRGATDHKSHRVDVS